MNTNGNDNSSGGNSNDNGVVATAQAVVLGYNDLGMHCMNEDFSELMILPPFNTLHAQVIQRGADEPRLLTSGITVAYSIPGNTTSANKTNFWQFAAALLNAQLDPDVGLTGSRLTGVMRPSGSNDWVATGIPVTPLGDDGVENPYPLATVRVERNGTLIAQTQAVVPVSWEIRCDLCHATPGISTATDILRHHDQLHRTALELEKPVMCAACHADPALEAAGAPGVPSLSAAMHGSHASRMTLIDLAVDCYACHPGERTQCLRDVHFANGMQCADCHDSMEAVGNPDRQPWVDLPRCEDCHRRSGFQFEEPQKRYRDSRGHGNVHCEACHGSPHAVWPTVNSEDNLQPQVLQGHSGTIDTCAVCHTSPPDEGFFHRLGEGDND